MSLILNSACGEQILRLLCRVPHAYVEGIVDTWASLLSLSDRWSSPSTWSDLWPCRRTSACQSLWWSAPDTLRRMLAALSSTASLRAHGTRWLRPSRQRTPSSAGLRSLAADAPGRAWRQALVNSSTEQGRNRIEKRKERVCFPSDARNTAAKTAVFRQGQVVQALSPE